MCYSPLGAPKPLARQRIKPLLWLFLALAWQLGAWQEVGWPAGAELRSVRAQEWQQFRGPNFGHVAQRPLPLAWGGVFDDPLWKTQIPGKGWSSPIVIGSRIWVTSSEQSAIDTERAEARLSELPLGARDLVAHGAVRLFALELDAETGQTLRRIDLFESNSPAPIHSMNSYASPTPTCDGQRLYCHFGALGTACIELDRGVVLWKRELVVDELTGSASSPVLWGDCLYVACDGADQQFVIALDKLSGQTRWKVKRPAIETHNDAGRRSFSTPIVVQSEQRCQLISMSAQWLISYNPLDGSQWWQAKVGEGYSAVPTPVFDRDRVFICTGFTQPELVAVDTRGSGDVTTSAILWRHTRQVPEISSPIIVEDEIYFGSSQGVVTCLDVDSGRMYWQQRLGGSFAASPIYADHRLYFTNSSGVTTVIQPGREYQELASNELFGESFASLAVYQSSFLVRTHPWLFRWGVTP